MTEKKEGGFASKLGSLFVREIPDQAVASSDAQASNPTSATEIGDKPVFGTRASNEAVVRPAARRSASADPDIVARIKVKIDGDTHEAYARFNELLEELREIIPDDQSRLKAALVSMKKLGFDEKAVIGIYDSRIKAIEGFSFDFDEAHKRKVDEIKSKASDELAKLDQSIHGLEDEISNLTQRLIEDKSRRSKLESETDAAIRELSNKGSQTKTAIDAVRHEFQTERDAVSRLIS